MNKQQVIAHMRNELDWMAKDYMGYKDPEVKMELAEEFKQHVRAYKALIRQMYKKEQFLPFRRDIERYIQERKEDGWQ